MGLFNSIRLGSSAAGDYEIERSLKFHDDDSAYLIRTNSSAGNRRTYTISVWAKIIDNGTYRAIIGAGGGVTRDRLQIFDDDKIVFNLNDGGDAYLRTNRVLRDPSAWYHLVVGVDTTQGTASNRIKLYVNGVQETSFTNETYPSQNYESRLNDNNDTYIGNSSANNLYFDGYLAEFNFIDGLQLTPSSFGKTDPLTDQWIPKKYGGSYGTNGFFLDFSDNSGTTATTLGKDSSGNGNNFTPNNFSVAAGVGNDSVTDTPTNNFCTFNPLKVNPSAPIVFKEGNLEHNGVSGNNHLRSATTMQVTSGKWYVEFKFVSGYETTNGTVGFGICTDAGHRDSNNDAAWYENSNNFLALQYRNDGEVVRSEVGTSTDELTGLSTFVNGDVMGLALDLDNDKFFISKNGTWFSNGTGTQDPANGTNPLYSGGVLTSRKSDGFYFNISGYSAQVVSADFGQHGYAYTPPTGFKAVNTANLPDPSIALPDEHFAPLLYTGNDTDDRSLTVGFQPDLTILKQRDAAKNWYWYDSVRGVNKQLLSNASNAEAEIADRLQAFESNGIQIGASSEINNNSSTYVNYSWNAGGSTATNNDGSRTAQVRANTTAGFSIVTSTSGGSSSGTYDSFGHGLGVAPNIIIFKNRDISDNWSIYNSNFSTAYSKILQFNTIAETTSSNHWGTANPTSTTFSLNQGAVFTGADQNLVAYCFSEVAGYSKFGSYTGNGSADGTFVYLGFRPALVIIKRTDTSNTYTDWFIFDNKRTTVNDSGGDEYLEANTANAEVAGLDLDMLSNGFKPRDSSQAWNASGGTFIYMAFAKSPFKYSRAR